VYYIGIYIGSEKARFIPLVLDKDRLMFIRDILILHIYILYLHSSGCDIDEDRDNKLA